MFSCVLGCVSVCVPLDKMVVCACVCVPFRAFCYVCLLNDGEETQSVYIAWERTIKVMVKSDSQKETLIERKYNGSKSFNLSTRSCCHQLGPAATSCYRPAPQPLLKARWSVGGTFLDRSQRKSVLGPAATNSALLPPAS